jgi:hypothetical protein
MAKQNDASWAKRDKKNWIAGAVKRPGAFTAKADKAGKSVSEMASDVLKPGSHASSRTKKQAVLAKTFKKMAKS